MTTSTTTTTPIRLACMICDREDFDGITEIGLGAAIASGWQGIDEADVSLAADSGAWWTHLGWCPECVRAVALRAQAVRAMRRSEAARAAEGRG